MSDKPDIKHAVARPQTINAKAIIPRAQVGVASLGFTATARGTAYNATVSTIEAERTTAGIEVDHEVRLRYSPHYMSGIRYVEAVDGKGEYLRSTMGTAQDALTELMLHLLPPDDVDYPKE
jgi:hypothetical protein